MIPAAIILFRETLEASLIIGILFAATRGIAGRGFWIGIGCSLGLAGSIAAAALAGTIAQAAGGFGQELFSASALLLACSMLGWHQFWMSRHAKEASLRMRAAGSQAASMGSGALRAVAAAACLAMLREGAEAALFVVGASQGSSFAQTAAGSAFGLAAGAACGWAMYIGLVKLPLKTLFGGAGWLIAFLAAGMAAQAAGFLVQADLLPSLIDPLWNSSAIVPLHTPLGQILKVLIGYDDKPNGMQLFFYLSALTGILCGPRMFKPRASF